MIKFEEYCLRLALGNTIEEAYEVLPKAGINPFIYVNYLYTHPELWNQEPKDVLAKYDEVNWSGAGIGAGLGGLAGSALGPVGTAAGAALGGVAGNYASRVWGGLKSAFNQFQANSLIKQAHQSDIWNNLSAADKEKLNNMSQQGYQKGYMDQQGQEVLAKINKLTGNKQQPQPTQQQQQAPDWTGPKQSHRDFVGQQQGQGQFQLSPQQIQAFQAHLAKTLPEVIGQALKQAVGS